MPLLFVPREMHIPTYGDRPGWGFGLHLDNIWHNGSLFHDGLLDAASVAMNLRAIKMYICSNVYYLER